MKKLIIISLFIFSSLCLNAYYWNQTRISFYKSHDTEVYGGENNFMSELIIDKLNFRFQMNSLVSEEGFGDLNSFVTNEIRSLSTYQFNPHSRFFLGYNVDYYDYDKTKELNLLDNGIMFNSQPLIKNHLYLYNNFDWDNISIFTGVRGRRTLIDYHFKRPNSINTAESEYYDEFYKDISIFYQLNNEFMVYSTFENKSFYSSETAVIDPKRDQDYTHYGLGVNYVSKDFIGGKISEDFQYLRKDSEQYASYQKHNFINKLRYNYTFTPYLSTFISYISRFSYDNEEKEFYRLSNMARVQARLNLPNYNHKAFIIAGSTISFENLNRIYFGYAKFPLTNTIAISLEDRYSHNVYNTIVTSIDYSFNSNFLFYLENNYTESLRKIDNFENENTFNFKNSFVIGTRMLFR